MLIYLLLLSAGVALGLLLGLLLARRDKQPQSPPSPLSDFSDLVGFEAVGEAVIVTDATGNIFYLNPLAAKVIGYEREAAKGLALRAVLPLRTEGGEYIPIPALLPQPTQFEGAILRENKKTIYLLSGAPLPAGRGNIYLIRDVTEQVEARRGQLEFASTVSHELRTPLATINGYLELLLRSATLPAKERGLTERAYEASQHMSRLIQSFLRMTQVERGTVQALVTTRVDLEKLLTTVVDEFRSAAQQKSLQLNFGTAQTAGTVVVNMPPVMGDPDRLREVFENLLGNAVKFTEQGSVTLSVIPSPTEVTIQVIDTGIGISPEEQGRIFEQFYRADNTFTRSTNGTGIGLYVTKSLVESMGGRISVQSQPGRGSTFSVTLQRSPQ